MSQLFPTYQRASIEWVKTKDSHVYDQDGNEYLDFTSGIGVTNLGHSPEWLKQALENQLTKVWHMPNLYTSSLQEEVAALISQENEYVSFFCNSGTEANEAAIKLVRKATGKNKIITFNQSFHGRTFGSMSATGQEKIHNGFGSIVPDFVYANFNDKASVTSLLDDQVAGVMLELVQGEGGVYPAEKKWVNWLVNECQEKEILVVVDEVQTGIGRLGKVFGHQEYEIEPDIFTLAKALGNGVPVGAMVGKKELASVFSTGTHGSTFGGNPLAMIAAKEVLKRVQQHDFIEEIQEKGSYLFQLLTKELTNLHVVKEIRGKGLMLGIELTEPVGKFMEQLTNEGLLVLSAGPQVIRLLPPLTMTKSEMDEGVQKLTKVLKIAL